MQAQFRHLCFNRFLMIKELFNAMDFDPCNRSLKIQKSLAIVFWRFESPPVAPLRWPSVGVKPNTWKSRELESFGTPECSELDSKAENTSPWGVLSVIGKVSKCRCPKWPLIGHLDIYSPSYGQKKGRESNWQFDSRPLKIGNRPVPDVRSRSATRRWKALFEGYKIASDLVAIRGRGEELWLSKVPGVQPGHIRDKVRAVVCLVVQVPVACPNTQGCPEC
jgi:hypothetical protein